MDSFLRRLLTVVAALFLIAYVGYQAFQLLYSPLETETVRSYSVYDTVDAEGITIRNETVIPAETDGYRYYTLTNGSKVAMNGQIAEIYSDENAALIHQQIEELETQIQELKTIDQQGTSNRVNLDMINKQIDRLQLELAVAVHSPNMADTDSLRSQLLSLMNKRQKIIGTVSDFSERIAALTAQKQALEAQASTPSATLTAPVAGYFVSTVDGLENVLDYDKVTSLTVEEVEAALAMAPSENTTDYAGKVVGDYEWYFTCVLDSAAAAQIRQDAKLSVQFPFVSEEAVPVEVTLANRTKDGKTLVVLKCSYMSEALADIRKETARIRLVEYEGLRVPDSALTFNDDGQRGVYVRVGNTVEFRKVDILYSESGFHICRDMSTLSQSELEEKGINTAEYLRLYDEVVVSGKKGLYDGKIIRS